jgi:hypothetical protein
MEHHRSDHGKRSPEIAAICLKIQKTKNILKSLDHFKISFWQKECFTIDNKRKNLSDNDNVGKTFEQRSD